MFRTFMRHMVIVVLVGGALAGAAFIVVLQINANTASAAALPPVSAPSIWVEQDIVAAPEPAPVRVASVELESNLPTPPAGPATTLVETRPQPEVIDGTVADDPTPDAVEDPVEDLQQAENRLASVLEQLNGLVQSSVKLNESLLKIKLADEAPAVETSDSTP